MNYKNNKEIMKEKQIRKLWEEFVEEYNEYFISNEELWINKLKQLKKYINTNKKLPSRSSEYNEIKQLGQWLSEQKKKYKNNKEIMKEKQIRKLWEEFIEKYNEYFMSNEEKWIKNLEQIKQYIDINNTIPSRSNKSKKEIKQLCQWLDHQKNNYKNNQYNMKEKQIRKLWKEFVKKYNI